MITGDNNFVWLSLKLVVVIIEVSHQNVIIATRDVHFMSQNQFFLQTVVKKL